MASQIANRFRPLGDRILVKAVEIVKKSAGGVLLPDSVDVNTIREGTVVAAGPGRTSSSGALVPLGLKVGDVVVFPKDDYVGKKIKMEGEDFLLMREEDVFGKKL